MVNLPLRELENTLRAALGTTAGTGEATVLQDPAGDISGGVSADLEDNQSYTLYLNAAGAVDITVELSPNGGTDQFDIPESPIQFSASGDDVIVFDYDANHIELTGSDATNVQAIVREVR